MKVDDNYGKMGDNLQSIFQNIDYACVAGNALVRGLISIYTF